MTRREPHERRVFRDIVQTQRLPVGDHRVEHTATARLGPDRRASGGVDADLHEMIELSGSAQNCHRPVSGADQIDRRLHDPPHRRLQVRPRRHGQHRVEQALRWDSGTIEHL